MATAKRLQYLHAQLAWMLGVVLVLVLTDTLSLPFFVIGSVIGLLTVTALTAPRRIRPQWRRRLRWLLLAAGVVVCYLLYRRLRELVGGVPFP
jgi:drug/metabolite transporter (DMT)-like permease